MTVASLYVTAHFECVPMCKTKHVNAGLKLVAYI